MIPTICSKRVWGERFNKQGVLASLTALARGKGEKAANSVWWYANKTSATTADIKPLLVPPLYSPQHYCKSRRDQSDKIFLCSDLYQWISPICMFWFWSSSLISRSVENISCKSVLVTHVALLTVKKHKYKVIFDIKSCRLKLVSSRLQAEDETEFHVFLYFLH